MKLGNLFNELILLLRDSNTETLNCKTDLLSIDQARKLLQGTAGAPPVQRAPGQAKTTLTWWRAAAAAAVFYLQNQGKTAVLPVLPLWHHWVEHGAMQVCR